MPRDLYTRLFDFFWKPFAFIAGLLLRSRWIQRSRFAPYVLGATIGRWPEEVEIDPADLEDLDPETRELILKRARRRTKKS